MKFKTIKIVGNDTTLLVTFDDKTTETITLAGLPTSGEVEDFNNAVENYLKLYARGKAKVAEVNKDLINKEVLCQE